MNSSSASSMWESQSLNWSSVVIFLIIVSSSFEIKLDSSFPERCLQRAALKGSGRWKHHGGGNASLQTNAAPYRGQPELGTGADTRRPPGTLGCYCDSTNAFE